MTPRANAPEAHSLETSKLVKDKTYLRQVIELLLNNETNVTFLQGSLFGEQYGLFGQLTPSEEERIQDPLYQRAQDRVREMKKVVEDKISILFQNQFDF